MYFFFYKIIPYAFIIEGNNDCNIKVCLERKAINRKPVYKNWWKNENFEYLFI